MWQSACFGPRTTPTHRRTRRQSTAGTRGARPRRTRALLRLRAGRRAARRPGPTGPDTAPAARRARAGDASVLDVDAAHHHDAADDEPVRVSHLRRTRVILEPAEQRRHLADHRPV